MNGVLTLTELYRFSPTFQRVSEMQFDTPVWLGIISYGILAPLGEEIVFRGVVYGQLRKVLKCRMRWCFPDWRSVCSMESGSGGLCDRNRLPAGAGV
ncbi:MAG: type II CAAX prenyl endopeptidase Rce1 family protein [Gallintestinimicrobium sp.]